MREAHDFGSSSQCKHHMKEREREEREREREREEFIDNHQVTESESVKIHRITKER